MNQVLSPKLLVPTITVAQRTLNLSFASMCRLNSAWGRLTTVRKAIVVGPAVAAVMVCSSILSRGKPDAADNNVGVMFCITLVLLMWGLFRLFGVVVIWVVLAVPRVFVALALLSFTDKLSQPFHQAATQQKVRMERTKVRIGMTIHDVLPLVHGMKIFASADGAWLSVLPDNKLFYYRPGSVEALQHDDGTFTFGAIAGRRKYHKIFT